MSEFEIPIGSLEEQALKRKERLRNLKRKAATKDSDATNSTNNGTEKMNLPLPSKLTKTDTDEPIEEVESGENKLQLKNDDVISKISSEVEALKTPIVIDEIDIQNLAPRKPDWDLKRDVAKKLDILDRRTQRAIAELIRERLQSNQGDVDLQAVNAVGYTAKPTET